MERMTITIDDALVREVKKVLGVSTKAEAIRIALMEVLRRKRLANALKHQGKVELDINQQTLMKHRRECVFRDNSPAIPVVTPHRFRC